MSAAFPGGLHHAAKRISRAAFSLGRDRSGQVAVEYSIIAVLVGVMLIGSSGTLKSSLRGTFNRIGSAISQAMDPAPPPYVQPADDGNGGQS